MVKEEIKTTKKGHTYMQWIAALLASCLALSFGLESGWISPVTKYLQSAASPTGAPLSDNDIAWVASAMTLTATIGVPIFAYISDVYGSKFAAILLTIPQMISLLLKILYPSTTSLIIARAIAGLSTGGVFNVVPMYVKEISQDDMRGVLGSLLVLFQNIGIFVMYIIGAYMEYYTVLYISLALPIILFVLLMKIPQSPLFLVKQEKIEEAAKSVALLRGLQIGDKSIQGEVDYMKNEEIRFRALPDISFNTIGKEPSWRRGLMLILLLFTFQAFSGGFIMLTYASAILVSSGVEFDIGPELQTLSLPLVMIVSSLALTVVVERYGRKIILTGAFFLTFVSMVTLGGAVLTQRMGGSVPSWLPVSSMILSMAMFAGGISPLPYIVATEMFSYQIRAKMMGGVVSYGWLMSFVAMVTYTTISTAFGEYTTFFVFGIINLVGSSFVLMYLPETKGKNDEEIRQLLSKSGKGKTDYL